MKKLRIHAAETGNGITEGVIWKQLLLFFFPIMLGSFFQQMYNTADTMIVGRFAGTSALAAVGSTSSFVNLLFGFFVGLASGATVILAQYCGARNNKGIHDAVHTGIALSIIGGLLITVLGIAFGPMMMRMINVPEEIFDDALAYLRIFFGGMVFSVLYNIGSGILRALGDSKRPLYFLIAGCFINVFLDLLFVAVFKMAVVGAAIATVLSQAISAVLVVICLLRRQDMSRLIIKDIRIEKHILGDILHIGVPAGLQSVMYSVSNLIIQSAINSFGEIAVAAWTAMGRMDGIIWLVMGAFGTAITTFVGQNFGAQKYERLRRSCRVCMVMAMVSTAVLSLVICLFGRQLLGLFTTDTAVLDVGQDIIWAISPFYVTYVAVEILSGTIRGTGDSVNPVIITALCTCLFRVFYVTACKRLGLSIQYVAYSYAITWTLSTVVFAIYYLRGRWLKRRISIMGYIPEDREPSKIEKLLNII